MPRILVADDNSNIQRMVALALQGPGVEVVAVGNGEAAVRKLPGMDADLILADIFMPVRNGYEVCEFVKNDPRFSHIPVVLLVGAFDPLDEVEAQRVSADGILKKPFVPPDPLINMVKSLLAKSASERLVAVAVPAAASAGEAESAHSPSPVASRASIHEAEPLINEFSPALPEVFPTPDLGVTFGGREKPLAFRPLVETPGEDDADLIVTASRDPVLGEPAFWTQAPAPAEEAEADEAVQEHSWGNAARPLPIGEEGDLLSHEREDALGSNGRPGVQDIGLRDLDVAPPEIIDDETLEAAVSQPGEPVSEPTPKPTYEPTHEIELSLAEHAAAVLPLELEPASRETETAKSAEERAPEEPSSPESLGAVNLDVESHDLAGAHDVAEESPAVPDLTDKDVADKDVAGANVAGAAPSESESIPDREETPPWLAPVTPIFPGSESLWAVKPESLTDTQEITPEAPEHAHAETTPEHAKPAIVWPPVFEPFIERPVFDKNVVSSLSAELAEAAVPVAESEVAKVASEPPSESPSESMAPAVPLAIAAPAAEPAPANPELIEAVVTRIVDRMQPKVIEVVTREILRPLVEALVRREINKQ